MYVPHPVSPFLSSTQDFPSIHPFIHPRISIHPHPFPPNKVENTLTKQTDRVFNLVLWELVECWLVLILGSLPPLRALFLHFFHHHHHHHQSSSLSFSTSRHTEQFSTNRGCSMYSQAKRSSPTDEEDNSQGSVDFVFRKTVGVGIVKTTDIRILREGGEERGDGGERGEVGGES